MSLKKTIVLPNETSGSIIRIGYYHVDLISKQASAHFHLYVSEKSPKDQPLCLIAKLRLEGEQFDRYLGAEALAKMEDPGTDPMRTALYNALMAGEPALPGGGLTRDELVLKDASRVD